MTEYHELMAACEELCRKTNDMDNTRYAIERWADESDCEDVTAEDALAIYKAIVDIVNATERLKAKFVIGRAGDLNHVYKVYRKAVQND